MTAPFVATFRPHTEADVGFIVDTWIRSYHDGSGSVRRVLFRRYKPIQREIIGAVLERGQVRVACDPDDGALWGFAAAHDDEGECVLDYVYVTQTRRRYGLARDLVAAVGAAVGAPVTSYSHHTVIGEQVLGRRLGLRHNPFALVRFLHANREALRPWRGPHAVVGADPDVSRRG
jgi:hypothetical protein